MEAKGKHDFEANDTTELSFKKGDNLLIMNYGDPTGWFKAELDGKTGLVPCNYIQIDVPKWYMGRITRAMAEQLLVSNNHEGAFVVRLSESSPEDFSLSVKCGNAVQHFRILRDPARKFYLWPEDKYDSLNALVANHRTVTVSRNTLIFLRDFDEGNQIVVQAIYDFTSEKQDNLGEGDEEADAAMELEFKKGEIITVFDSSDENWWGGRIGDRHGYFPRTYVQPFNPGIVDF